MDKVIIDGIDVSECKNFGIYKNRITQEAYHFCNKSGENCKELKDCYYKQLKRLEQENEQIKKDYAKLHIDFAKCNEENEWLEKEVETWIYQADKRAKLSNIRFNTAETYKQALQEIKQKLDMVMTEEFTISEEWKPFELIDECRNIINKVIGAE